MFHEDPGIIDFHEITLLPDGETLLVVPHRAVGILTEIAALRGGERRTILSAPPRAQVDMPRYSPTGHLVFVRREVAEGVWAVPFDSAAVAARGEPFRILAGEWAADVSGGETLAMLKAASGSGVFPKAAPASTMRWTPMRSWASSSGVRSRM